mgnify:CR=1 FL=1
MKKSMIVMAVVMLSLVGFLGVGTAGDMKAKAESMKGEVKAKTEEVKGEINAQMEEAKGNDVSATMELLRIKGMKVIVATMALGRTWRRMMVASPTPRALAART